MTQIKANQNDPSQTNFNGINYKGKVIFLKRVTVTDYDFTNGNELLFQGSDNLYDLKIICIFDRFWKHLTLSNKGILQNEANEFRHIIVPFTDPKSVNRFLSNPEKESLEVNQAASVIPKIIKKKKVGERFPLLTEDINATRDIILQLVEFYSIVRRFYDDSKEKIDFFIGPDPMVILMIFKAIHLRQGDLNGPWNPVKEQIISRIQFFIILLSCETLEQANSKILINMQRTGSRQLL